MRLHVRMEAGIVVHAAPLRDEPRRAVAQAGHAIAARIDIIAQGLRPAQDDRVLGRGTG